MIRMLVAHHADAYVEMRRQALAEAPLVFASSPTDDIGASREAVCTLLRQAPESVVIGAFFDNLVGAVGLYRDRHLKFSHKAHLWGMYVIPNYRGRGVAAELLDAALHHAHTLAGVAWMHLSVTSAAPVARRLYERAGFHVWGTEPEALCYDGQTVVDYHMALHLIKKSSALR
jgi:ribosomal protein S18 acetylase RimI-like enzyme